MQEVFKDSCDIQGPLHTNNCLFGAGGPDPSRESTHLTCDQSTLSLMTHTEFNLREDMTNKTSVHGVVIVMAAHLL